MSARARAGASIHRVVDVIAPELPGRSGAVVGADALLLFDLAFRWSCPRSASPGTKAAKIVASATVDCGPPYMLDALLAPLGYSVATRAPQASRSRGRLIASLVAMGGRPPRPERLRPPVTGRGPPPTRRLIGEVLYHHAR